MSHATVNHAMIVTGHHRPHLCQGFEGLLPWLSVQQLVVGAILTPQLDLAAPGDTTAATWGRGGQTHLWG